MDKTFDKISRWRLWIDLDDRYTYVIRE